MARCRAVMNQRMTFFCLQKLGHVRHADFQFERGGHAVQGFHALALEVLSVLVEIDEAGSDDQAARADHPLPAQRIGGNASDLAAGDADVADGVETRFWDRARGPLR